MHEATKKLINYVRLRIDEEEEKWKRHEGKQREMLAVEDMEKESLSGSEDVEQEFLHAALEGEDEEDCEASEKDKDESQSFLSHLDESHEREPQITNEWSAGTATDSLNQSSTPIEQPVEEQTKTYVLLLHFPPSVSQRACYPAMFLYGWDYHYLDSLVASAECAIPLKYVHIRTLHEFASCS